MSKPAGFTDNLKFIKTEEGVRDDGDAQNESLSDGDYSEVTEVESRKFPAEFEQVAKKYKDLLLCEKNHWSVLKYVNDLKISGVGVIPSKNKFSISRWDVLVMPVTMLFVIVFIIKLFIVDIPLLYASILLPILFYLYHKNMVLVTPRKIKMLRGVTSMEMNSETVASYITDEKIRKTYDTLHRDIAYASDEASDWESFI